MGKDALQRIREAGVEQKLVGVRIEGASLGAYIDGSMPEPFPVIHEGREVGEVTSACYSPQLETNIGLAMLPIAMTTDDTQIDLTPPYVTHTAATETMALISS